MRYFTPSGQPRGTAPTTWPGTRDFIGGTTDTTTGLTNLGAREYNPATPTFISPDPILNPYNPANLNPYDYAANNPVSNSDPSDMMPCIAGGPCGSFQAIASYELQQQAVTTAAVIFFLGMAQRYQPTPAGIAYARYAHSVIQRYDSRKPLNGLLQLVYAQYQNDEGAAYPDARAQAVQDMIVGTLATGLVGGARGIPYGAGTASATTAEVMATPRLYTRIIRQSFRR